MAAHAVQISTPAPAPAQASSSNLGTTTTTTKPLPGDASAQHNPGAPSVQPLHQAPNADPSSAEIPRCNMTARYTNAEWEALVQDTERSLAADDAQREYPLPRLGAELARCIDHTLLKLDATAAQIDELCSEARREGFEVSFGRGRGRADCGRTLVVGARSSGARVDVVQSVMVFWTSELTMRTARPSASARTSSPAPSPTCAARM